MRAFTSTLAALGAVSLVSAIPTGLDARGSQNPSLPDGLPNQSPDQLKQIEQQAFGTLSNAPPPPTISDEGITNLKLIAFNELFEVAFFDELVYNVTHEHPGYQFHTGSDKEFVLKTLKAVLAQEELHALNANNALKHFKVDPIQPCAYNFPVSSFDDAIKLAATFTSVVLGTLQDVVQIFAKGGDDGLARGVASVIGQEGEQEGYYRLLQGKVPNELPFLTTSVRDFAFTAIQGFTVPNSCPNQASIPLSTFKPLNILTPPGPKDQHIKVSWPASTSNGPKPTLSIVYINQQNLPIVETLVIKETKGDTVFAEALFPYEENEMNGLTIAAVTNSTGPFATADDVAKATLFAPGLIIVN